MEAVHWYSFTFHYMDNTCTKSGNCFLGLGSKRVILSDIKEAKSAAKMPADSVLIGLFYMGHMTRKEFQKEVA